MRCHLSSGSLKPHTAIVHRLECGILVNSLSVSLSVLDQRLVGEAMLLATIH